MISYRALLGSNIISSDAFILGEVEGIKYDFSSWSLAGILVRLRRGLDKEIISGKVKVGNLKALLPTSAIGTVNDVILLQSTIEKAKLLMESDNPNLPRLSHMSDRGAVTSDGLGLGSVHDFFIEQDGGWRLRTFTIRPDKNALKELGVKRPLFNRSPDIVLDVSMIKSVTELVQLDADRERILEIIRSASE